MNFAKKIKNVKGNPIRIPDDEAEELTQKEREKMEADEIREHETTELTVEEHIYSLVQNYEPESPKEMFLTSKIGQKAAEGGKQSLTEREQKLIYRMVKSAVVDKNDVNSIIGMQVIEELDEENLPNSFKIEEGDE